MLNKENTALEDCNVGAHEEFANCVPTLSNHLADVHIVGGNDAPQHPTLYKMKKRSLTLQGMLTRNIEKEPASKVCSSFV